MPAAIEEFRTTGESFGPADFVDRARPLVIRGLVRGWPIVRLARASDTAFAQRLAELDNGTPVDTLLIPPEHDGIVGYTPDLGAFNYEHHRVPLTQGLQRLAQYSRQKRAPGLAIQSALVSGCLPGFREEHALPFIDASVQPRLWIGNRVTTPVHFDAYHNIACVVCGARRFTLFPPEQLPNLYIGPLDFAPTGAAIGVARLDRPDDPRYPRLKLALAAAQTAELHPGDAIYIPPMWWHHVESLERLNALVNYWWQPATDAGRSSDLALGALFHCILGFGALTPAEKAGWKNLLDHYVFGDGDVAAHIPEGRRGMLGQLTPGQVEQLRQRIRRYL
ncbi:cupin-like domain-containing protein [Rhodanobacter aciditrophus]|uniref:cupin-like domain-containing protein n=1 Tax=Rhodanobacter aciditrophus TaxID=1623218 RepID=UPI003CEFABB8